MSENKKYKLYEYEKLVGIFTAAEIVEKIGIEKHRIKGYESNGHRYQRKYGFAEAEEGEKDTPTQMRLGWAEEWDEITARFRARRKEQEHEMRQEAAGEGDKPGTGN